MITLEDWALIRRLHVSEKLPKAQIARELGISRNTVAKAIASVDPPEYSRAPVTTSFEPFEVQVRQLLKATPSMPATVLAERVGWAGSATWFRQNVALIRPDYAPTDPADRIVYHPGDQVQCDLWFPEPRIPVEGSLVMLPVLVMVTSFSKFITAVMIPSRTTADLLAGMWALLSQQLGAVPRRLIWDNETGIGRRNRLAAGVGGFAGALATKIHQLKAYDPESKGGVERMNGYFETSFLPGRDFESPGDFNTQMGIWLPRANSRTVRALKARPVDLLGIDKAAMLALPPVAPAHGFAARVRLPRDYYVRVFGNDYSVHPTAIGRMVDVVADLDLVIVRLEGRVIADHPRAWGTALTITDPDHVSAAARLRDAFQTPRGMPTEAAVVLRDLADYDSAFGVNIEVAS
ncbi:IS21 family transposase [Nocardioides sp.]|uniref:IS21 family transposase n=1 Tax=Nocardioides sp. TaxID=35761 RepID=UPI002627BEC2|nr:IS21 family transposase [Nocardioides sp.]MDI6908210.1 IS21 family transposase [Nocardioides sp.]